MGFCTVAALHGDIIKATPELFVMALAQELFGAGGNYLVALLVGLACFTTAVALASIVSDFIQFDLLNNRFAYKAVLAAVLSGSLIIGLLEFKVISRLLEPLLFYLYPCLILLCMYVSVRQYFGKGSVCFIPKVDACL